MTPINIINIGFLLFAFAVIFRFFQVSHHYGHQPIHLLICGRIYSDIALRFALGISALECLLWAVFGADGFDMLVMACFYFALAACLRLAGKLFSLASTTLFGLTYEAETLKRVRDSLPTA